ncbi:MFS transporter [Pontiella agarivorans]|uniref:MFS transporter n=1 Tax=Pontiella agarivorans TaxID=3038953 RepID=A0ABU5N238_9BACT|nr:MFS transporter [Pontiella agarivorans]MDZ8120498.1 MFS transporter [Pontiella agarivorans]
MNKNMVRDLQSIAKNNVRRFITFRLLFNARFYYPVFAVIFLDFGMTLDQFAMLNAIWAATIILAEVPSGALSDLMGRKKLLILTSGLMVAEMAVWAFAPRGNPALLFWLLALNRVLSGLGEAAASGSDEALVYESLEDAGMQDQWSRVLESVTKWRSAAFMFAMIIGGLVYDPTLLSAWTGLEISKEFTVRLPLFLTFITSILCWINCLGFHESARPDKEEQLAVGDAFRQTVQAGRWIFQTPFALVVILAGAFLDSVIRMFITLNSEYYRLIHYPEFALGLIGAGMSLLNFVIAPLARKLVDHKTPGRVFVIALLLGIAGFTGASFFIPFLGVVFMILLSAAFSITAFAISFYLNRITTNSIRATVLSFKGMALNLGYGFIGIVYAQLLKFLENNRSIEAGSDEMFIAGAQYFPPYFLIGAVGVILVARLYCPEIHRFRVPEE